MVLVSFHALGSIKCLFLLSCTGKYSLWVPVPKFFLQKDDKVIISCKCSRAALTSFHLC